MASSCIRVKLQFVNFSSNPPKSLYLIDSGQLKKVKDLIHKICTHFRLDVKCDLFIDGYSLPKRESTNVLREDDVVIVQGRDSSKGEADSEAKKRKRKHESPSPELSPKNLNQAGADRATACTDTRTVSPAPATVSSTEAEAVPPIKKQKTKKAVTPIKDQKTNKVVTSDSDDSDDVASKTGISSSVDEPSKNAETPKSESVLTTVTKDGSSSKNKRKRKRKRKNNNNQQSFMPTCSITSEVKLVTNPEVLQINQNKESRTGYHVYQPNVKRNGQKHVKFDSGDEQEEGEDTTMDTTVDNTSVRLTPQKLNMPQQVTTSNVNLKSTEADQHQGIDSGKKNYDNYSNQFAPPSDYTPNWNKPSSQNQKPQKKKGPFSGAQIFSRQKFKKNAYYPLSKEEQLSTVASNESIIIKNGQSDTLSSNPEDGTGNPYDNGEELQEEEWGSSNPVEDYTPAPVDFSHCCPLEGPPRVGDVIAYKVLELSESYTPEMSDYKEAKVLSYDAATKMLTLVLAALPQARRREGRFELTVEDEDYILTNSTENLSDQITVCWSDMLEPRLVPNS